ncbi:MAG TPA: hypothetical protein VGJ25_14640 [Gaiellaceae bacterium]
MAQTARHRARVESDVPVDPHAIARNYQLERARRRARIQRRAESRRANLRFYVVLAVLVVGIAVIGATIWHQIQQLFGL